MKNTIILATYNVRQLNNVDVSPHTWAERCARCRKVMEINQMDLVGLQEPFRPQVDDLVQDSPYQFIGVGRNDFKDAGEFSCILYRKSRFEVLKSGTFGLSETPDIPGVRSWGECCPRIATWGLFRDKQTGVEFTYYNAHLDHISEIGRINGIRLVVNHAAKNAAEKPLILSGDFNAYPDTPTYHAAAELLRDAKLCSETQHTGPEFTFHDYGKFPEAQPIDYIFVSKEIKVLSHRTDDTRFDGKYASDHFPIVTELAISGK